MCVHRKHSKVMHRSGVEISFAAKCDTVSIFRNGKGLSGSLIILPVLETNRYN